jgi:hypothetical protein
VIAQINILLTICTKDDIMKKVGIEKVLSGGRSIGEILEGGTKIK